VGAGGVDPVRAAEELVEAFNAADWDRIRGRPASDAVYAETGTGRRVEGVDAYIELVQGWKEAFPDVRGTIRNAVGTDTTAAQEILWEGAHSGPLQTPAGVLEASGRSISVEASLWSRFEGDKAREVHHYLDVMTLLQQVGAG
jgi:steroid delta-isomerase-like uncharacterized protein